ncbi:thioesterase family protein [Micromonospora echinaurantiaca]|uniref:thioesterase family protein n=1 Tax=Micromonospora TaxID=1873 RepID=UPI00130509DD|nr:thioesterase family protein [Micromonospora sp. S4605]
MGDLASDTEVESVAPGRFAATLSADWQLVGPNGGYLAAVALRAGQRLADRYRPASMSCQFLAPARFGRVELTGTVLRVTERATALRVAMFQSGDQLLEAQVWATPEQPEGPVVAWHEMPAAPGPDRLPDLKARLAAAGAWVPRWHDSVTLRVVPGPTPELTWARFRPVPAFDEPWLDACRALILVDSLQWPAIRVLMPDRDRTLALTTHLAVTFHRDAGDAEWLLVDARGAAAAHGFVGGTAAVWSDDGQLIAAGQQQMLLHQLSRPAAFSRGS